MIATLSICRDGWTGQLQVSIENESHGYRICGPKFNGSSKTVLERKLTRRDADEIRSYLDAAFPLTRST